MPTKRHFGFNPARSFAEIVIRVPIERLTLDELMKLKDLIKPPAVSVQVQVTLHLTAIENGTATDYPALARLEGLGEAEIRKVYNDLQEQIAALD